MTALLVALGAAIGAPLRFLVATRLDARVPVGTLLVNVTGSALLGLLVAIDASTSAVALVGTGFCGAFTTYSGFALQSDELGARRGTTYVVVTVVLCLGACAAAYAVAA